jgi:hypothetical protein
VPQLRGCRRGRIGLSRPVDATLGVEGTPQSGTGQAALLTGVNAAAAFGRHFGPWVPTDLRPLVRDENVLVRARAAGHTTTFANAYPREWARARADRRPAAPPLAALGAGLMTRHAEHLARGEAVTSEIVNDGWIRHLGPADLPRPTPLEAGRALGRIAGSAELTLFAHYTTDTVGHRGGMPEAVEALERVDALLEGVLETLPPGHRVVIASDHGNIEEVDGGHTRNPALGVVVGAEGEGVHAERVRAAGEDPRVAEAAERFRALTDLPELLLGLLA